MNASLLALWKEGRTRFTKLLDAAQESDLPKRNGESPNSAGFLIRHMAEVELLFAKNVFGLAGIPANGPILPNSKRSHLMPLRC